MATKALNLANDQQTIDLQSHSDNEDSIIADDTNNNAQDKAVSKSPVLKIQKSFSKCNVQENECSPIALQLHESSVIPPEVKDDVLKSPASGTWTLINDLKAEVLQCSSHHARNHEDFCGSLRNSVVIPLLASAPEKDESPRESEKGFSKYFSQSGGAARGKTEQETSGGETSKKSEPKMAENADESATPERFPAMFTKTLTSTTEAELFGSSQLPTVLGTENGGKNRQKPGTQAPSQAAPVKPRCTPAREAVDPAKYFTLTDEPDGTKYACSKCGNVYKWRKSLNKHWKEKHGGETPNLHARPPPSLLQREHHLSPIRGASRHSSFQLQPGFHGSGSHSKSSATPVIPPPRLHSMHGGKNPHGASSLYHFGKSPVKDDGREPGSSVHQVEELVTAVVRPSRSSQSPIVIPRWFSPSSRPTIDLPSSQKLKIPMLEYSKSAHDHTQPRDNFGQMFSAVQGHHTVRGRPLDLSVTVASYGSNDDNSILDLSRKGSLDVSSSSFNCATTVQDEPLDFSAKSLSKSLGYPKNMGVTSPNSSFSPSWFHTLDGKDTSIPKAMDFSDVGTERKSSLFSINDFDRPSQVVCARCRLPCETVAELNHHFARHHMDVLYETSADVNRSNRQRSSISSNQLLRYLNWENAKKSLSCVVCDMSVQWSWMLGKHFEQMHSFIQPNPYKKTSAISTGAANNSHVDPGAPNPRAALAPNHQCVTCSFSTDSAAEFSRHQLKHSLAKDKGERGAQNYSGCPQNPDDDQTQDPTLRCSSASPLDKFTGETIDLDGESTTIVFPQAPEETHLPSSTVSMYQRDVASPDDDDSASAFGKLPCEDGMAMSGEDMAAVIAQESEDASAGSSPVCSTPSGSKGSRSKRDPGLSTESLLPFKCELCEYRARWPSEMMQHMKNHSDEKPYQCPQCSYRSKWKWDVVKHLKRCGGGGSVKDVIDTTIRKKSYVKSLLIDSHSHQPRYEGPHSCSSLSFPGFYEQLNSPRLHDPLLRGPPNVTVFSGMNDVNKGMNDMNRGMNSMNDSLEEMNGYENRDSDDAASEDLAPNKSEQDREPSQNNHACPQCPFVGHSPAELKRHLRVHSDEKPYTCQTCSYSSKWKCDLKKHLKAYNHVSAVPLGCDGEGKNPTTWSQVACQSSESAGKAADLGESDSEFLVQGGGGHRRRKEPGSERPSSRDSGDIFGGITSGGRLRCRQCEFEAVDITSFLQHKKIHRNGGNAIKRNSPLPHRHHHRKSLKQTRVIPAAAGGRVFTTDGSERNLSVTDVAGQEEHSPETKRFWDSLGLQSINSVNRKRQSSTGESDENYYDPDSSDLEIGIDSTRFGSASKCARYDSPGDHPEFVKQFSQVSSNSYESGSDTEMEHCTESSELGNCGARAKSELEMEITEEVEKFPESRPKDMKVPGCSLIVKNPFQAVRRGLRQGVTTTEAEDAAGMSKRKRKLRTCEKCGYITDNLTTLQRHAAKHGSSGRHRCWMCDYSVDRQHVLEYHIKIVHEGASRTAEDKPDERNCGTKVEDRSGAEKRSPENLPQSVDRRPALDLGSFGGRRKIVCTTSNITVRGHEMEMIQKGNKTWYNCIKCHFVSSNITNAVNHAKQHGADKRYKCKHCDYSLDRKSSIANHMNSQHSQSSTTFQFDVEQERESGTGRWTGERYENETQSLKFSLLDKMNISWKKHTCVKCGFCSINPTQLLLHRLAHGRLDEEFGCKKCRYRSASSRLLASHMRSHDLANSIDCLCGIDSFVAHTAGCISSDQKQECIKYSGVPKSAGLDILHDSANARCTFGDVSLGCRRAKNVGKVRCPFCPFASFSALKTAIHRQHHNSLKKLECNECSFRANVRNVLYHHQKLHC